MSDGPPGDRVRTVFLGSGAFGAPSLRMLAAHAAVELAGVVTSPPRPVGRRQVVTPTPIGALATELGLAPILAPVRLRAPESIAAVLDLEPGLAVLADYRQIVPGPILDLPHGALNLHPSALPRFRGAAPVATTILEGDAETAVSIIRMDDGVDTGPIVAMERVALTGTETTPELEERLAHVAAALLERTLAGWLRGSIVPTPQPDEGVTITRELRREDGRLDPLRPARQLERQVRAGHPWPGSFIDLCGERVVVGTASVAAGAPGDVPGTIVVEAGEPALATVDGRLVLHAVTPAGRRPMSGSDWLRGRRVSESTA
jgi:methionyl-tRNA formyltransferase